MIAPITQQQIAPQCQAEERFFSPFRVRITRHNSFLHINNNFFFLPNYLGRLVSFFSLSFAFGFGSSSLRVHLFLLLVKFLVLHGGLLILLVLGHEVCDK